MTVVCKKMIYLRCCQFQYILRAYQRRGDEVNLVLRPSFSPFSVQKSYFHIYKENVFVMFANTLIPTQADDEACYLAIGQIYPE